jgi:hypothetical protein
MAQAPEDRSTKGVSKINKRSKSKMKNKIMKMIKSKIKSKSKSKIGSAGLPHPCSSGS